MIEDDKMVAFGTIKAAIFKPRNRNQMTITMSVNNINILYKFFGLWGNVLIQSRFI